METDDDGARKARAKDALFRDVKETLRELIDGRLQPTDPALRAMLARLDNPEEERPVTGGDLDEAA